MDYHSSSFWVSVIYSCLIFSSFSLASPASPEAAAWERHQRKEALGLNTFYQSESFKANVASNILGMQPPPAGSQKPRHTPEVPEIIAKIYDSAINRTTGAPLSRRSAFRGEVDYVRGLQDHYDVNTQMRMKYMFDTSHINYTEDVIEAEFHVYKRVLQRSPDDQEPVQHDVELQLYLIKHSNWTMQGKEFYGLELLQTKVMSAHAEEWVPFKTLKETVKHWISHPHTNKGLLLRAIDPVSHGHMNGSHIDFVQKGELPHEKQPVLVLFSDKVRKKQGKARRKTRETIRLQINYLLNEEEIPPTHSKHTQDQALSSRDSSDEGSAFSQRRRRREVYSLKPKENPKPMSDETGPSHCRKKEMFVSVSALGWSNWILYPEWLTVNSCVGKCRYPPDHNVAHTNHAILLSLVHHYEPDKVKAPCCVPSQLIPISLLFADGENGITIRQYENMHVSSCGCR